MIAAGVKTQLVANLSVQDGIQAVRKTLPSVYFNTSNDDVRVGLNALRTYQREWDDKRRVFKENPKHDWSSNPADAFRMLALALNPTAVKRESRNLNTKVRVKTEVGSNVLNLENLFADRSARPRSNRI